MSTTLISATLTSKAMCQRADVTYRQLTYWVRTGVLGLDRLRAAMDRGRGNPSGERLMFTRDEVAVVAAVGRVSKALSGRVRAEHLAEVADQVRSGADEAWVQLSEHVELIVNVSDLQAGIS